MNLEETYHEVYKHLTETYDLLGSTKKYLETIAPDSDEVGNPIDYLYRDVIETIENVTSTMYKVELLESRAKELQL